jgi:uncharacterized protein
VKIYVNQIPFEGVTLEEEISAFELELETDIIELRDPVRIRAEVSRITNAISAHLIINAVLYASCSRCLEGTRIDFKKEINLHYPVDKTVQVIDLNSDIREEILLDYPIKPLCNPNCKGLCPKCGNKLDEGGCTCGST